MPSTPSLNYVYHDALLLKTSQFRVSDLCFASKRCSRLVSHVFGIHQCQQTAVFITTTTNYRYLCSVNDHQRSMSLVPTMPSEKKIP